MNRATRSGATGRNRMRTVLAGAFGVVLVCSSASAAGASARAFAPLACSQSKLDKAVKAGGTYDFGAACTITITKTMTVGSGDDVCRGA